MKNKGKIACFLKTSYMYLIILYSKDIPFLASKFDLLCMSYLNTLLLELCTSISQEPQIQLKFLFTKDSRIKFDKIIVIKTMAPRACNGTTEQKPFLYVFILGGNYSQEPVMYKKNYMDVL
jgi:hypothetical protein